MQGKSMGIMVLALGVAFVPQLAEAAEGRDSKSEGTGRYQRLKALDTDKDGAISAEEFAKAEELRFARRDTDKDGKLGPHEVTRGRDGKSDASRAERLVKRYDANADGRVTREELAAGYKAWFAKRDKDGDGKLSAGERSRRFAGKGAQPSLGKLDERAAARFKSLDANGDGSVDAVEIAASYTERRDYSVKRAMHRLDKNGDGSVTPDEFLTPAKMRFSNLDIDRDGRITVMDLPPQARSGWTQP